MSRHGRILLCVLALGAAYACGSAGGARRGDAQRATLSRIRALKIIPSAPTLCAGRSVTTTFEVTLEDGSVRSLGRDAGLLLVRYGQGVDPRDDGSWLADPDPLVASASGYRLRVTLPSDAKIVAETTLAPAYNCLSHTLTVLTKAGASMFEAPSVAIRLSRFRSPFHDSIVVVAMNVDEEPPVHVVLTPDMIRPGAIYIDAVGAPGRAGVTGSWGLQGAQCQDGQPGGNGGPGGRGANGGRVRIIADLARPWLADLVQVQNHGGDGGLGGAGGAGGPAGQVPRGGTVPNGSCRPRAGQNGERGTIGPVGRDGGPARRQLEPLVALWQDSPSWRVDGARGALSELIDYSLRPRP